jgi:hypothetical protein
MNQKSIDTLKIGIIQQISLLEDAPQKSNPIVSK